MTTAHATGHRSIVKLRSLRTALGNPLTSSRCWAMGLDERKTARTTDTKHEQPQTNEENRDEASMAVSDVLFEAEERIREYQRDGIIAEMGQPDLELVIDIMRAARLQPGRDVFEGSNTFEGDVLEAFARYTQSLQI
jgi:hypothetical protein